ncbi:MAG: hypothetical protein IPG50_33375 [Myxococcales bacterium]|nr:hypothetical protein [Myxococcales bacterium]
MTTHVSAAYEEVQKGADLDQVHRISAGHGLVAEVTLVGQAAANERTVYFGTDHLGLRHRRYQRSRRRRAAPRLRRLRRSVASPAAATT